MQQHLKPIIITLSVLFWISSCAEKDLNSLINAGNILELQQKKADLETAVKDIEAQIAQLDSVIRAKDTNKKLPLITTLKVAPKNFEHYLELQGDVTTRQNVLVYPEIPGTLEKIYVRPGQRVAKGQVLALIDDGGLSNQLAQLKTQLALAKTTFERQERLWKQNIGSEIQYLQAKTQFEAQQNAVKQLERTVGRATVRAPFAGIVDDVIKDQGTVVAPGPGSEIFRVVNLSDMFVEVEVPEAHLGNIKPGNASKVYFPILNETYETKVRQTGNFINPANRSFTAEIPVMAKEGTIKPNLTAKVFINDYNNPEAILIPQSIVSENAAGEQYVYLIQKQQGRDIAVKAIITTGKTQADFVEVLSGIKSGDEIINEGARSVREGQEVKIDNPEEVISNS